MGGTESSAGHTNPNGETLVLCSAAGGGIDVQGKRIGTLRIKRVQLVLGNLGNVRMTILGQKNSLSIPVPCLSTVTSARYFRRNEQNREIIK